MSITANYYIVLSVLMCVYVYFSYRYTIMYILIVCIDHMLNTLSLTVCIISAVLCIAVSCMVVYTCINILYNELAYLT